MREEKIFIGRILKNARAEKKISLEKASKDTRITKIYLQSIEEDQLLKIPGDTVLRGFLKIYSNYLGMDPAPLLDELTKKQKKEKKHEPVEIQIEDKKPASAGLKNILKIACPAAISLLAVVLLLSSLAMFTGHIISLAERQKTNNSIDADKNKNVEVNAEIIDSTWALVQSDGKDVFSGMLYAGARKTWKGKNRIFMKIGNAAGIRITSGDKVVFSPGKQGDVIIKEFIK